MKSFRSAVVLFFSLFIIKGWAQDEWPKVITATDGSILKVYQPQPESFSGNVLKSRAAISLLLSGKTDPVFGTFWSVSTVATDRDNRLVSIQSVHVPNLKFADAMDDNETNFLKTTLETQLPQVETNLPLDELLASLNQDVEAKKLSTDLDNKAPKIIYAQTPSTLVLIDGTPKFKRNDDWGVDAVVNSPFTIVKNDDGNYYLYGGKKWYSAANVSGPYSYVNYAPANLEKIATSVNNVNNSDPGFSDSTSAVQNNTVSNIIVSTTPAELIQSNGSPQFTSINGTSLEYVNNSANDIFMDQNTQQYYVLISGRWYNSTELGGSWQYIASNSLPADFAKIPEGSAKDNVLASIAGTQAAREAVMDAQIPQTAKVDRHNATTSVTYDGSPQFQNIPGTDLEYAVNTQSSVINYNGRYYCVDKGVWFVSDNPQGPWAVSTDRPDEVDNIPPSNPDYNLKYVYVYDATPDWVYMGYTPGYLNNFIYGPTIVYGTGYYYQPWFGNFYYPRPYTWGFGMNYNPWYGWGFGYGYGGWGGFGGGWFHCGFGLSAWGRGWGGGWWGPSVYRPPFYGGGFYGRGYTGGGFYGAARFNNVTINRTTIINNYNSNIYGLRRDVVTNTNNFRAGATAATSINRSGTALGATGAQPATGRFTRTSSNMYTDHNGNVYRNSQGQWQQRQQHNWTPVNNNTNVAHNLSQQQQMQVRGEQRTQNFQMSRSSAPSNFGGGRPSGGGAPSGGHSSGGGHPH